MLKNKIILKEQSIILSIIPKSNEKGKLNRTSRIQNKIKMGNAVGVRLGQSGYQFVI
jgi:hypothetical protein